MAAAALFAVATAMNIRENRKQAENVEAAQREAQKVDIASQNEVAMRERRRTIKEAMIRRAQVLNMAGATDQLGSSAVGASTSAISGDLAENIGSINTAKAMSSLRTQAQQRIFEAQQPSLLQQVSGAAQQGAILFKS